MSKVDRKLFEAKYGSDPVAYFEHLPDVESVEVVHDEIKVNYKPNPKEILWGLDPIDRYIRGK